MQNNRIWKQVADFMQRLRCENLAEKALVQMPEQNEVREELKKTQFDAEELLEQMPDAERGKIQAWIDCLEDNASVEAQQAYSQGYVDCILLLSGMGLLRPELAGERIMEQIGK